MRNSLPSLRVLLVVAILVGAAGFGAWHWNKQRIASRFQLKSYKSTGDSAPQLGQADEVDSSQTLPGAELLAESARRLLALPNLECKIRQRVELFDQQISGVGSYSQWSPTPSERPRVRWELKFQVGQDVASIQQINDGRFFWSRRDLPGEQSLSRIDLRTVRDVLQREARLPPDLVMRNWMALGGLSRLVHGLNEHFQFGLAQPRLVDDTPVWVLVGTWKPEILALLVPSVKGPIEQRQPVPIERLPAHLPDVVVIVMSRDSRLPAFPYRIEYRRSRRGETRGTAPERNGMSDANSAAELGGITMDGLADAAEIAVLDFYEVNLEAELEPQRFAFQPPASQQVLDDTERFLLQTFAPSQSSDE